MKKQKPLFVATFGYPGSGKSYFSERLGKQENWVHVSADKIRLILFPNPTYTKQEHEIVFRLLDYLVEVFLLCKVNVVYDANFNFRKDRKKLANIAKKTGSYFVLAWLQVDEKVALKRIEKRKILRKKGKSMVFGTDDVNVFTLLKNEMELPTKSEPVVVIDGTIPFSKQFKKLINK